MGIIFSFKHIETENDKMNYIWLPLIVNGLYYTTNICYPAAPEGLQKFLSEDTIVIFVCYSDNTNHSLVLHNSFGLVLIPHLDLRSECFLLR